MVVESQAATASESLPASLKLVVDSDSESATAPKAATTSGCGVTVTVVFIASGLTWYFKFADSQKTESSWYRACQCSRSTLHCDSSSDPVFWVPLPLLGGIHNSPAEARRTRRRDAQRRPCQCSHGGDSESEAEDAALRLTGRLSDTGTVFRTSLRHIKFSDADVREHGLAGASGAGLGYDGCGSSMPRRRNPHLFTH